MTGVDTSSCRHPILHPTCWYRSVLVMGHGRDGRNVERIEKGRVQVLLGWPEPKYMGF